MKPVSPYLDTQRRISQEVQILGVDNIDLGLCWAAVFECPFFTGEYTKGMRRLHKVCGLGFFGQIVTR